MRTVYTFSLVLLVFWALPAQAMRCGAKIVSEGDYALEVLHICGEPEYVEESTDYRYGYVAHRYAGLHGPDLITINVEVWTYNFGPHKFMRRLRFENGRLISIRTLGYGHYERRY